MKDPAEQAAYQERKTEKANKRMATSSFGYESAGGMYVPTREQHDFAVFNRPSGLTSDEETAFNMVAYGYSCGEKVHHDHIHIVNEYRRKSNV
jgi:hypothetical protein